MLPFPARFLLPACLLASTVPVLAQPMQAIDDGEAPVTTIPQRPQGDTSSTETRLPGARVTEIEVRSGGSTYYLRPQDATGAAPAGRTTQWNILQFDAGRAGSTARQAAEPALAPVPPPPALRQ